MKRKETSKIEKCKQVQSVINPTGWWLTQPYQGAENEKTLRLMDKFSLTSLDYSFHLCMHVRFHHHRDSPCDENQQPYHTETVAARVNKDRVFRRIPGRRCQICYWCIIKDSWKRQHHNRLLEHKDTKSKSCRETPGTNIRNGEVQMEHPWTL